MNQGQTRIPCPKCRSNNFPGQTNCWQCGASLPPPNVFAPPVYTPPQPPAAGAIPPGVQIAIAQRHSRQPVQPAPLPYSGSLPNEGSIPPVQSQYSGHQSYAYHADGRGRSRWLYAYYGIFGFSVIMALVYVGYYGKVRRDAISIDQRTQAMQDAQERIMQGLNRASATTHQPEPGSIEAKAQEELKKLYQQSGMGAPPTDPHGNVHLRSGGEISREQWEKAKQSLQQGNP
jgi:hypothetical protein